MCMLNHRSEMIAPIGETLLVKLLLAIVILLEIEYSTPPGPLLALLSWNSLASIMRLLLLEYSTPPGPLLAPLSWNSLASIVRLLLPKYSAPP